jgi:phosphohistidine phosphatase
MKVVLIRHAHAIDPDPSRDAIGDGARWLTEKGRTVARRVGERLREEGWAPAAFVTSPLVRAVQTAELVARGLKYRGTIEVVPALGTDGSLRAAAAALEERGVLVAAVGHEPAISALASQLAGRSVGAFRKGQAVVIQDGKVAYRLDPEEL